MAWTYTNHFSDCYFCLTKISGHSKKTKSKIVYPDSPSALRPVAHASDNIPVPSPPSQLELRADKICESATSPAHFEVPSESSGADTIQSVDDFLSFAPHLLDQSDLNDLIRDLGLTKKKSELLASRLKQWNLLQNGVKGTFYRTRHAQLEKYFAAENDVCYCSDVPGLFEQFDFEHDPAEWRLFIDSSKSSLKAVLLHIRNKNTSIPVAYAYGLKKTYKLWRPSFQPVLRGATIVFQLDRFTQIIACSPFIVYCQKSIYRYYHKERLIMIDFETSLPCHVGSRKRKTDYLSLRNMKKKSCQKKYNYNRRS